MNTNQAQVGINTLLQLGDPITTRSNDVVVEKRDDSFDRLLDEQAQRSRRERDAADDKPPASHDRQQQAGQNSADSERHREQQQPQSANESPTTTDEPVQTSASDEASVTAVDEVVEEDVSTAGEGDSLVTEEVGSSGTLQGLLQSQDSPEGNTSIDSTLAQLHGQQKLEKSDTDQALDVIEDDAIDGVAVGALAATLTSGAANGTAVNDGEAVPAGLAENGPKTAIVAPVAATTKPTDAKGADTKVAANGATLLNDGAELDVSGEEGASPELLADKKAPKVINLAAQIIGNNQPVKPTATQLDAQKLDQNLTTAALDVKSLNGREAPPVQSLLSNLTNRLASQISNPAMGPLQTQVKTTVGQPQWAGAIAERVAFLASQRVNAAEIHLDPPELGPLQVRVTVAQEQASVQFVTQHGAVKEALDQSAFRLREMFDQEGMNLVDVDVSDQSFAQQREDAGDQTGKGSDIDEDDELQEVAVKPNLGLVDHFV